MAATINKGLPRLAAAMYKAHPNQKTSAPAQRGPASMDNDRIIAHPVTRPNSPRRLNCLDGVVIPSVFFLSLPKVASGSPVIANQGIDPEREDPVRQLAEPCLGEACLWLRLERRCLGRDVGVLRNQ